MFSGYKQNISIHYCFGMVLAKGSMIFFCGEAFDIRLRATSKFLLLQLVTLASTDNVLPEDGVTAPKHVGAILM